MKKVFLRCLACMMFIGAWSQQTATININVNKLGATVEPTLHGRFFEEISHGGEGGLYAELIQNRGFEESRLPLATTCQDGFIVPNRTPHFSIPNGGVSDWKMEWNLQSKWPAWSLQTNGDADILLALTTKDPLTNATSYSALPYQTSIGATGEQMGLSASLITIAADNAAAENSFEEPRKYIPQQSVISGTSDKYQIELKPYSISVLRFKDVAWKDAALNQ